MKELKETHIKNNFLTYKNMNKQMKLCEQEYIVKYNRCKKTVYIISVRPVFLWLTNVIDV